MPKLGDTDRDRREHQDRQREDQHDEHRHLHVVGLDLLAQVLRRAADHQAGDEHRQDDEDEDAVHPGADAAEDHLAQHDVDERHQAAERRERVVPAVDRAAARVGRHGREERGVGDAEAALPCLPCCRRTTSRSPSDRRRPSSAAGCRAPRPSRPSSRRRGTGTPSRAQTAQPCSRRAGHVAERVGQAGRDREDREHLDEVRRAASGSRTGARCWR